MSSRVVNGSSVVWPFPVGPEWCLVKFWQWCRYVLFAVLPLNDLQQAAAAWMKCMAALYYLVVGKVPR